MDLKQLEYFVNVVDLGGFSRAGRLLGVAQPAISRQIRSLEVELRQNLLLRNGRGATPTEAGKRRLGHARGILQQVDRARREVDETKDAPVGHVVIGLPQFADFTKITEGVPEERIAKATGAAEDLSSQINALPIRSVSCNLPSAVQAKFVNVDPGVLEKMTWNAINTDYSVIASKGARLKSLLQSAKQVHVTNPDGTDFTPPVAYMVVNERENQKHRAGKNREPAIIHHKVKTCCQCL